MTAAAATETPTLNFEVLVMLGDGAEEGVTSVGIVVAAVEDLLVLRVEGEVTEDEVTEDEVTEDGVTEDGVTEDEVTEDTAAKEADSEVAIDVDIVAVGMELEELVPAALAMLSNVGVLVLLLLSIVTLVAEHCPSNAQYWSVAQHVDPQNVCPRLLSQINEGAATFAVVDVCAEVEVAAAENG